MVSAAMRSASEILAPSSPLDSNNRLRTLRKPSCALGLSLSVRPPCQTVLSLSCRCSSCPRVWLPPTMSRFARAGSWSPLFVPVFAPPKIIAPRWPLPMGSASVQTGAGLLYQSVRSGLCAQHRAGKARSAIPLNVLLRGRGIEVLSNGTRGKFFIEADGHFSAAAGAHELVRFSHLIEGKSMSDEGGRMEIPPDQPLHQFFHQPRGCD